MSGKELRKTVLGIPSQFTMRSILFGLGILVISLAFICNEMQERHIADALEMSCGRVVYYRDEPIMNQPTRLRNWWDRVFGVGSVYLVELRLDNSKCVSLLEKLCYLRALKVLRIDGLYCTDNQLTELKRLYRLERLELVNTSMTKSAVSQLRTILTACDIRVHMLCGHSKILASVALFRQASYREQRRN